MTGDRLESLPAAFDKPPPYRGLSYLGYAAPTGLEAVIGRRDLDRDADAGPEPTLDDLRDRMRAAVRVARTLPRVTVTSTGTFVGPLT
jgi:hypothetical protein